MINHNEDSYFGLLGAGSQANEITEYIQEQGGQIKFLAVDQQYLDRPLNGITAIDIARPSESDLQVPIIVAVGAPALKKALIGKWRGKKFSVLVAESAWVARSAELGDGTVISPQATVTYRAAIGKHVLINIGASVSHDSKIGNYCTISPGARIGGHVSLGEGVFVGIGATIKNDITIAEGCVVAAGAVVLESVETPNSVLVGVPAKVTKQADSWLSEIK